MADSRHRRCAKKGAVAPAPMFLTVAKGAQSWRPSLLAYRRPPPPTRHDNKEKREGQTEKHGTDAPLRMTWDVGRRAVRLPRVPAVATRLRGPRGPAAVLQSPQRRVPLSPRRPLPPAPRSLLRAVSALPQRGLTCDEGHARPSRRQRRRRSYPPALPFVAGVSPPFITRVRRSTDNLWPTRPPPTESSPLRVNTVQS